MTRKEFTKNITILKQKMVDAGDNPMDDWLLRTAEVQNYLFKLGKSKCDGYKIRSRHQDGLAEDIYFEDIDPESEQGKTLATKWHLVWITLGGKPIIEWDKNHYE